MSVLAIPSSIPNSSSSLHRTQGGDDGENLDKGIDLVLVCDLCNHLKMVIQTIKPPS